MEGVWEKEGGGSSQTQTPVVSHLHLTQTLDIGEHSKSGLGYDWCYRLKPGSNTKVSFIRKRNYKHGRYRHVVRNFVLMGDCRCGHVADRERILIFERSFCLKQQLDHCTFCLHAFIDQTLAVYLAHCIILCLEPRR
jgi:hypothetical protein